MINVILSIFLSFREKAPGGWHPLLHSSKHCNVWFDLIYFFRTKYHLHNVLIHGKFDCKQENLEHIAVHYTFKQGHIMETSLFICSMSDTVICKIHIIW